MYSFVVPCPSSTVAALTIAEDNPQCIEHVLSSCIHLLCLVHPAQLLLTIAEDNHQCIENVLSSGHVAVLMEILTSSTSSDTKGLHFPLKASVAGIIISE